MLPKYFNLFEPLGNLEFSYLVQNTKNVITESGGITEDTTIRGMPCNAEIDKETYIYRTRRFQHNKQNNIQITIFVKK